MNKEPCPNLFGSSNKIAKNIPKYVDKNIISLKCSINILINN